ncbi:MAG: methylenetetrahydrofolate reductase [Thermodesulfobacteriota bacterium]
MKSFEDLLASKPTVITVEVTPPKGADSQEIIGRAKKLKGLADAIDITSCPMAKLSMSSVVFGHLLKTTLDIDVLVNVTTRDRNILGIQSELLGAHALGIKNLVSLKGDRMSIGDFPDSAEVFEVNSIELLGIIKNLNTGLDALGRGIKGGTDFFSGAVLNPNNLASKDNLLRRIKKRQQLDVRFFLTQPLYSIDKILAFGDLVGNTDIPIILGILPLKSRKMAETISKGLPGVEIPTRILDRISELPDEDIRSYALENSLTKMEKVKDGFAGFHIMTAGDLTYAKNLIELFNKS